MPTGGTSLQQREARAFDERARAASAALASVMLGIARPELLPEAPLGQFLREDAAASIKRMRVKAYREDFSEAPATPPKSSKPPKPTRLRGPDPTVYLFILPEGEEVACTRKDLQARVPNLNSGSLFDLVHGLIHQAKGVRCHGPVERTNG